MKKLSRMRRTQAACEACYLLNEAIRELIAPPRVYELTKQWDQVNPVPEKAIAAARHMVLMTLVVIIFRLNETREKLVSGWLLSEDELRHLDFPPLKEFIGGKEKWARFETLRNQYAGHPFAKKGTKNSPPEIISPKVLARAVRESGLWEEDVFINRVLNELPSGVEKVLNELIRRYPDAEKFVNETFPDEFRKK